MVEQVRQFDITLCCPAVKDPKKTIMESKRLRAVNGETNKPTLAYRPDNHTARKPWLVRPNSTRSTCASACKVQTTAVETFEKGNGYRGGWHATCIHIASITAPLLPTPART